MCGCNVTFFFYQPAVDSPCDYCINLGDLKVNNARTANGTMLTRQRTRPALIALPSPMLVPCVEVTDGPPMYRDGMGLKLELILELGSCVSSGRKGRI